MPLPDAARDYLLKALDGTPVVLSALLGSRPDDDPIWDRRPDPERFTLREVLAHLADWEPIWLERVTQVRTGSHPFLPSIDEGALAVANGYESAIPSESLRRFVDGRRACVDCLRTVGADEWDLTCDREFVGELTLQQLAYYILAHDAYHLRQAAEYMG
ncbi:MAG TPA: DinB family protein [Fimbriimonadaceae bacterium]|nr:DinB family protein [Fimbriimonadaceae bacterium]